MVGDNWLYQVDQYISQGRVNEAQDLLIQVVKDQPDNAQAWLLLADSVDVAEERLQVLDEALRQNPGNREISEMRERTAHPGSEPPLEPWVPPASLEQEPAQPEGGHGLGAFAFSAEEWETFKNDAAAATPAPASTDSFQPPALLNNEEEEKQWLESLRSVTWSEPTAEEPPAAVPAEIEPPVPGSAFNWQMEPENAADEVSPELASLAWQPVDSPLTTGSETQVGIYGRQQVFREESEPTPVEEPPLPKAFQAPQTSVPALVEEVPEKKTPSPREELLGDLALTDLEEPAPKRTWLVFVIVAVLVIAIAAGAYLAWPSIMALIPTSEAAPAPQATVEGGAILPTAANTATPVPTLTPTATRTRTSTPLPFTATPAPLSAVVNAVPITLANVQQFKLLAQEKGHFDFSNDVRVGASMADNLTVRVWDVAKNEIRMELKGPRAPIQSVAVSPDGKLIAAACEEPAVYIWNAETGAAVSTLDFSKELVDSFKDKTFSHTLQLKFGPEGKTLVVGSLLGVTWWELDTKKEHHLYPLTVAELVTFREQAQSAKNGRATSFLLAFSPDGKSLAVGSPYKVYLLFWPSGNPWTSLATAKPLIDLKFFYSNMLAMFHPGTLSVWETISSRQILSFPGLKTLQPQEAPPGAAFRPDGKMMAVESENARGQPGAFRLIDLPSGKYGLTLDPNTGSAIENPIFSADGKLLMARSGGDLFVWDVATGKELRRIANRKGFTKILNDGKIYVEYTSVDTILFGGLP